MLAPTVAAVKFDLPSTPERAACAMKIDQGLKTFWNVVEHMQHAADRNQAIHQVEETVFRNLLVIGRWLLQAFLDMAGTGDVGPTLTIASDSPSGRVEDWRAHGRVRWLVHRFRSGPQAGSHGHVSSPRLVKPGVRVSRTGLSCSLRVRGYGTYHVGETFGRGS